MMHYVIVDMNSGRRFKFNDKNDAEEYIQLHRLSGRLWRTKPGKEREDEGAYIRGKPYLAKVNARDAVP